MNFKEIAENRQSCRNYDKTRPIEEYKLKAILTSALLAPSACNSQPYNITVCKNTSAKLVAEATMGMGMNKFTADAPIMLVISESEYSKTAAIGSKIKSNDYRSIDIGILAAYITAEAVSQGLGSCILGWFDDKKIRKICNIDSPIRLVISIGYPDKSDVLRQKKRKDPNEVIKYSE